MKTSGELKHDFYEWFDKNPDKRVWDWVHLQLKQSDYKQSIISLIDDMIEEENNVLKECSSGVCNRTSFEALESLKQKIEVL